VLPEFEAGTQEHLSDWNDKVASVGVDEARVQFRRALQMAEREKSSERRL
jgi:hypothetical protein